MKIADYFGPSTLVTAAFIGPGTVTLCSLTGASTGYNLIWVLVFSVFTAIIFQEMAARLGVVTQEGLGEAIRKTNLPRLARVLMIIISFAAIIIGNAAYEAGNLAGAVLGLDLIIDGFHFWPLILGLFAGGVLFLGNYAVLEKVLIGLVLLMSVCFIFTAFVVRPPLADIAGGLLPKKADFDSILLLIGLIGTTVVPYNLFLHASSISEKYTRDSSLKQLRIENALAISLGGVVSIAIIISSAAVHSGTREFSGVSDFALQLEPLLGAYAKIAIAIGFFAAGLSSAITAPLAAAYAARGLFALPNNLTDARFRLTWFIVVLIGVLVSMSGFKPIALIKVAQVANGLLLPIIAGFLIYVLNSKTIVGEFTNSTRGNAIALVVLAITLAISVKTMLTVFA